ncbi:MAG: hypothetical protein C0453_15250 [Comamonadaceae bacterium]|nr:hypothetical protein [Comamonadaceae bacterium]
MIADLIQGGQLPWADQIDLVELPARQELHAQGAAVLHIHFPISALVILTQASASGVEVPVALVGNDGVLGMAALMGVGTETHRAVVLHPGLAWRLPVEAVPDGGSNPAQVVRATMGHLLSLTSQIAQTAFCQQQHNVEQRLSRWLLTALDRLPETELAIDLPELAPFLGVSDGALSRAAASLVERGVLVREPGRLAVPMRTALQAVSCGCHMATRGTCLSSLRQH